MVRAFTVQILFEKVMVTTGEFWVSFTNKTAHGYLLKRAKKKKKPKYH